MRILTAMLAGGLVASVAGAAVAADGWYAGAAAGVNIVPRFKTTDNLGSFDLSTDVGYNVIGRVGHGFGPFRVEGELGWRGNEFSKFSSAAGSARLRGTLDAATLMANVYWDIPTGTAFTPYIGGGAGGAWFHAVDVKSRATSITLVDNTQSAFAYQGIAGLSYAIDDKWAVDAGYRYFATERFGISEAPDLPFPSTMRFRYTAHDVMLGFTYKIGP